MSMTITSANFESEVLQSPIPVLIDFWAPWCGSCKMMSFLVDQVAEKYAGRIKIGKVNVAEEGGLAEQHNIVSLPTLVIYQYGAIFQQKVGGVSKQDLENFFKDVV